MTTPTHIDQSASLNDRPSRLAAEFKRTLLAIFASSLSAVPLGIVFSFFDGGLNNDLFPLFIIVAMIIAFAGVLFVGLPVHFFLTWRRLFRPLYYGLAGFFVPATVVLLAQSPGVDNILQSAIPALYFGAFGLLISLVFRYFALKGKILPDSACPNIKNQQQR